MLAAIAISLGLVAALTVSLPFARRPTHGTEIILPAYAAATFILEIITAALLFSLFNAQRTRALLLLAAGYLFSALTVPTWALSFPGVFDGLGIDLGLQTTAVLASMRRLGFPLFILAYALSPLCGQAKGPPGRAIGISILGVCLAVASMTGLVLANYTRLPAFMLDGRQVNALWFHVPSLAMGLYGLDIVLLLYRRRALLDIWVCLVLFSLVIELLLISYLGGAIRFSVGWWTGRIYGLIAASLILLVLLSETTRLHARLMQTIAAERRIRQNRLIAMEALSASIAHEINQPLASMVTNADAALRWLARQEPRIDNAEAALRRIVDDGHRANKVVAGIRATFSKGTQERAALKLNTVVSDALRTAAPEAGHWGIALELDLDPTLPPVIGNAVQLLHVLRNLVENAIDAVKSGGERPRHIRVTTRAEAMGEVRVSVEDNGSGIPRAIADRLFDPFVSTKPGGMGMGLMFCRSVIEAHGGRISVESRDPRGAIFHFTLPAAIVSAVEPVPFDVSAQVNR
ncbi:ATP-binding protein [Chelatococcus asaccharovorans]|uniref:histidine kinase n=1 Tax=Chelatococcus asaccharovorans TaxID=28210 RepID=A0A2V3UDN1_9HYPH|nr:ATP-binding protein [Chelatococcus asaccharovorans]PXW63403.1 phospho-acceptor domain-containing protein [Chelatococcus asaccharovorans]